MSDARTGILATFITEIGNTIRQAGLIDGE